MKRHPSQAIRALLLGAVRRHPAALAAGLGVALAAATFGGVECAVRARAVASAAPAAAAVSNDYADLVEAHPLLGVRPKRDWRGMDIARNRGEVVYEARYSTDALGRRVVPGSATGPDAPLLALFGCSFTFGTGVHDAETYAAQVAERLPGLTVHNFGVPGYAFQHMWLLLRDPEVAAELRGRRGVVVYMAMGHHVERLVGDPSLGAAWLRGLPRLSLGPGGVQHEGFFDPDAPAGPALPWPFAGSRLLAAAHANLRRSRTPGPQEIADQLQRTRMLIAAIFDDCAARLRDLSPDLSLVVAAFPGSDGLTRILPELERRGYEVWDYRTYDTGGRPLEELWFRDSPVRDFGHPKAAIHELVAERMAADLAAWFESPGVGGGLLGTDGGEVVVD